MCRQRWVESSAYRKDFALEPHGRLRMGCTSIALVAMRLGDTTLMCEDGSADHYIDGSTVRVPGITLRV
jgi:hypothetical protein